MQRINNGLADLPLRGATWRKSSYSNPSGNCVEVTELADGRFAVRNSRQPSGPALIYTRAEMAGFIASAKVGEFDG